MALPVNQKVQRKGEDQMKLWIYGEPTIGKTIFANKFPDVLMLNTDGNIKYVDSPVVPIVASNGKDAWEVFVETVTSITSEQHTYKTIVVDLLDDIFQYCRQFYSKKLKIDHEADLGYGKGYDIVRNAFLIVIRTLVNSGYNVVLISHEKAITYKDRVGRELTKFQPAMSDTIMNKISGMVDITGRIMIKSEEKDGKVVENRILYLTATNDQVGGNRVPTIKDDFIPLSYEELLKAYKGGNK